MDIDTQTDLLTNDLCNIINRYKGEGHNGLKSIQACVGTPDFWRIRLGIGHPGDKARVSGYVLSDFSKEEQKWLPDVLYMLAKKADVLISDERERYAELVSNDL